MDGVVYGLLNKLRTMEKLTQEKIEKGLEVLNGGMSGKLLTHLNSCVHCGLCAESCVYYQADPQAKFIPATKVELVSSKGKNKISCNSFPFCSNAETAFPSVSLNIGFVLNLS